MNKSLYSMALCLFICLATGTSKAQTLVLHHANGTTTDVELLTQPQVKFQNDKVLITSIVLNMEFPKEDILTFTFKGKAAGIKNVQGKASVTQENGRLIFHGIKSSDKIAVYNTKGIRIPVSLQRSGDFISMSISSIPTGVYLLNVNGKTSKFTKK